MTRRKLRWLVSLVLMLALVGTLCWAMPVPPNPSPFGTFATQVVTSIAGVSHEIAPSPDRPFVGSARFGVDGATYEGQSSSGPLAPGGANFVGVPVANMGHVFNVGEESSLITTDTLLFLPVQAPGWFVVSGTLNITDGTGLFAGATGAMDVMGQVHISEAGVEALFLLEGPFIYWVF